MWHCTPLPSSLAAVAPCNFLCAHPQPIIHHAPSSTIHHPSSTIHHPPSIIHHPSSTTHHPSSIIRHPPSAIHHPPPTTHHHSLKPSRRRRHACIASGAAVTSRRRKCRMRSKFFRRASRCTSCARAACLIGTSATTRRDRTLRGISLIRTSSSKRASPGPSRRAVRRLRTRSTQVRPLHPLHPFPGARRCFSKSARALTLWLPSTHFAKRTPSSLSPRLPPQVGGVLGGSRGADHFRHWPTPRSVE